MWHFLPHPHPLNPFIPDICLVAPLVSKVARSCVQPWTQVTIDNYNKQPSSTLFLPTILHSAHYHLVPHDVSRRLAKICSIVATVARVILLQHWRLLSKDHTKHGGDGTKHSSKSYPPNQIPSLWLITFSHIPFFEPPLSRPYLRTMCPAVAVHILPRQQPHTAKMCQRPRRQDQSFFFSPTNRFSDLSRYNILHVIQHCYCFSHLFLFLNSFQTAYNFKST